MLIAGKTLQLHFSDVETLLTWENTNLCSRRHIVDCCMARIEYHSVACVADRAN